MKAAGTDTIGVLRWGLRHYRALFLACLLVGGGLAAFVAVQRDAPVDAEALVIAKRLDIDLVALPRYGEAVFNNGQVTRAIADTFGDGGAYEEIIPDRVSLETEQDSIVFRVVGHDVDPQTAADLANQAAQTFTDALNTPGAGVGRFDVQSPAGAPQAQGGGGDLSLAVPIGLGVGLLLGLAMVALLLVVRRPVIDSADVEEATGVAALGTVVVPRLRAGTFARPEDLPGLVPVCRRLLGLATPIVVMTSPDRHVRVREQLSVALAQALQRVRGVRFIGPPDLEAAVGAKAPDETPVRAVGGEHGNSGPALTLVDGSEPLDLIQPPEWTVAVLVVPEGIGSTALRAAVIEHVGGSAEARVLLYKRGGRLRRVPTSSHAAEETQELEPVS